MPVRILHSLRSHNDAASSGQADDIILEIVLSEQILEEYSEQFLGSVCTHFVVLCVDDEHKELLLSNPLIYLTCRNVYEGHFISELIDFSKEIVDGLVVGSLREIEVVDAGVSG